MRKDYIPVIRVNNWISGFGTGSNSLTLIHGFINCQAFKLTANRGTIANRIINMNINYFMVDNAGRVYHYSFKALKNTKLRLKDQRHTMANPESYFKENYPELR